MLSPRSDDEFQVVPLDIRLLDGASGTQAVPAPAPTQPAHEKATWQQLLKQACTDAHVSLRAVQACAAAESLGVAVWEEVGEVAEQIAQMSGMKLLERRRFLAQVR